MEIRFEGKGGLAYQVVGSYFLPWDEKPANEALSIDVAYDRAHLAQDDIATATATIKSNLTKSANMVMVDLGIPPGFDLLSEDLQTYVEKTAARKAVVWRSSASRRRRPFSISIPSRRVKRSRCIFACGPSIRSAPRHSSRGSMSTMIRR